MSATFRNGGSSRARSAWARLRSFTAGSKAIRACPKPVIAAVEKVAAGAGVSLALACDLIVSSREARYVVAYVKIGLSPDGGATASLMRLLPRQLVTELCLFGDPVGAETLHRHGVINRLTEPGAALDEAMALARRLADGPQNAIGRIKQLLDAASGQQLRRTARHGSRLHLAIRSRTRKPGSASRPS